MKNVLMLFHRPYFKGCVPVSRQIEVLENNGYMVDVIDWQRDIPTKGMLVKYLIFIVRCLIYTFKYDADVFHCHDIHTIIVGVIAGKIRRIPVIYDVHDLYHLTVNGAIGMALKVCDKIFAAEADAVIVPSSMIKKRFYKDATVIWNTPDISMFRPRNDGSDSIPLRIGYFGSVRWQKYIYMLLKKDDVDILISGGNASSIDTKGKKNVTIGCFVPEEKLVTERYWKVDAIFCIYPPDNQVVKYSVPMKVFEAMACGIPVIANKEGYYGAWVTKHGIGVTIKHDSMEELNNAIGILQSEDKRKELGRNGRRMAEEEYNQEVMGKRLLSVYEEIK